MKSTSRIILDGIRSFFFIIELFGEEVKKKRKKTQKAKAKKDNG